MIPKIIHYCWFGGKEIPDNLQKCIESWSKIMPDYEIKRWDESNFDINICKYIKDAYDNKKYAFVSDFVRLYVCYEYGGIYLDTDVEVIKSFDDLLELNGFMGFEQSDKKELEVNTGIGFGVQKGIPIIKDFLDDYFNRSFFKADGSLDLTPCPQIQTSILKEHGLICDGSKQRVCDLEIFPVDYFCPMNQINGKINITSNTYSIHRYFDSWNTPIDRRRRELRKKFSFAGKFISNAISSLIVYFEFYGIFKMWPKLFGKIKELKK